jgi:hypothetical protein
MIASLRSPQTWRKAWLRWEAEQETAGAERSAVIFAGPPAQSRINEENNTMGRIACLIALILIMAPAKGPAQEASKEQAAVAAAEKWLGLVDDGRYAESWKEAATPFRNAVKQEQWEQAAQAVRKPLGKLVSRQLKSKAYKTSLPGAPDGEYVVIQFDASFANKKSAVETVTPMVDKDGKWRVSGYFIK